MQIYKNYICVNKMWKSDPKNDNYVQGPFRFIPEEMLMLLLLYKNWCRHQPKQTRNWMLSNF